MNEFISDMRSIRDEVSNSDMQAMVEAYTIVHGGDDDEILKQIYNEKTPE